MEREKTGAICKNMIIPERKKTPSKLGLQRN
jgi:hypothetical protein